MVYLLSHNIAVLMRCAHICTRYTSYVSDNKPEELLENQNNIIYSSLFKACVRLPPLQNDNCIAMFNQMFPGKAEALCAAYILYQRFYYFICCQVQCACTYSRRSQILLTVSVALCLLIFYRPSLASDYIPILYRRSSSKSS